MINKKEIDLIDRNYFNVLQAGGFAISLQSANTKHFWHLILEEYPTFRHFKVYHKHNWADEYHSHRDEPNLKTALLHIMEHDAFQMNGRRKVDHSDLSIPKRSS